jgi:hypothetical protein
MALAFLALVLLGPFPLFFLVPLAGFLIIAGPVNGRAWRWTLGSVVLSGLWLALSGGIVDQVANAMAILMTGAFIILSLSGSRSVFTRAAWSVLVAVAGVTVWCWIWGITWQDIELAITREWWAVYRMLAANPRFGKESLNAQDMLNRMADAGQPLAQLYPARLILCGILGLWLAATWAYRITGKALGEVAEGLGTFRFTDHLVWVVIAAVAVLLLPSFGFVGNLAERFLLADIMVSSVRYWEPLANNVLVVCAALYAARGIAVLSRFVRLRGAAIILIVMLMFFLLPFALIGLTALGLADTWVDFRRWVAAPIAR